jgi:uncharacterized protein YneF (UPF0154 family)
MIFWITLSFAVGFVIGDWLVTRVATKHLREQNDLLEQQNKVITQLQAKDASDFWKPEDWKADWKTDWHHGDN